MKKTIANKGKRPTTLTRGAVRRVARAVNAYERGDRDVPGRKFRRFGVGGGGENVRLGKTTAVWEKYGLADITLYEDGEPGEEEETDPEEKLEDCVNYLHYVAEDVFVLLSMGENGAWYLVASEMPAILTGTFTAPWPQDSSKTVTVSFSRGAVRPGISFPVTVVNKFAVITGTGSRNCAVAFDGDEFCLIAAECD